MGILELYEIYYLAQEAIDRLLQFLITISFAVVVAGYLGSEKLNGYLYFVIGIVFSLVFLILALRMNTAIEKSIEFQQQLELMGEVFEEFSWVPPLSGVTGVFIYLCTIAFLFYCYRKGRNT